MKFNQNAWLKLYIDMNTDLIYKAKTDFGKCSFRKIYRECEKTQRY